MIAMNGKNIRVRVSDDDVARLERIAAQRDKSTMGGLVRAAMRIGLDAIERKPSLLDQHDLDTRGGARPGAGAKPRKDKKR